MTKLRTGITTGTCASAAAGAAARVLCGMTVSDSVNVQLPNGDQIAVPILYCQSMEDAAVAAVRKDAGDDPDVTDGMEVVVRVWFADSGDVTFLAGDGVGTITKPGLQLSSGEPAINPTPRKSIAAAIREVTDRPVCVEISIPGGQSAAAKTFNPKLGIVGGLSILGTTGIVRPYCRRAMIDAICCTLDVAEACGVTAPILVPGNIGASGCKKYFQPADQQLVEVGNEWGQALRAVAERDFSDLLAMGHPGKLAKLAAGYWNTHSSNSPTATSLVHNLACEVLGNVMPESETVEGLFAQLDARAAKQLGDGLAERIGLAITSRIHGKAKVAVFLINMAGECIGQNGDFSPWKKLKQQ